jgi:AcrR family transcriptional regulator
MYLPLEKGRFDLPTQTFFNLPEEKRDRILEAAMQEFADYSFDQSSIARIIENAGIPRGSFYQYFENLKDLYKYIFDLAGKRKIQYFSVMVPHFQGEGFDFFHTLRELFVAGIQFAKENPLLLAIGNNFFRENNISLRNEILGEQLPLVNDLYAEMIRKGIQYGQLDSTIDPSMAALFMRSLYTAFSDYFVSMEPEAINSLIDEKVLLPMVDQMLYLLANGLKNKFI